MAEGIVSEKVLQVPEGCAATIRALGAHSASTFPIISDTASGLAEQIVPLTKPLPNSATVTIPPLRVAMLYRERDRVNFSDAMQPADLSAPELADAVPEHENLIWGVGEAIRSLEEALKMAQTEQWKDWSEEARAFRWHNAGRTEMHL